MWKDFDYVGLNIYLGIVFIHIVDDTDWLIRLADGCSLGWKSLNLRRVHVDSWVSGFRAKYMLNKVNFINGDKFVEFENPPNFKIGFVFFKEIDKVHFGT